jgi:hypothetical protein
MTHPWFAQHLHNSSDTAEGIAGRITKRYAV